MKKVIIIGAGPAGITAAYELLKRSEEYSVTVLEESQAIGGISRTVEHHGNRMDLGGHRFFSKDERVTKWWEEMMPTQGAPSFDDKQLGRTKTLKSGGPDPEKEDRVMLVRNRVSRIYYKKKFFDYPISLKPKTIIDMGFWATMKAGFSYLYSCLFKKEEDSLENFYINRFGRVLYGMFFEGYTEKLWGRHPKYISAAWGSQRVKGLSILAVIKDMFGRLLPGKNRKVETSLIEEFVYPKFGPGQLWETAMTEAEKLGAVLIKGAKATRFEKDAQGKICAVIYETVGENGETIEQRAEADIVISSMPVKELIGGMEDAPEKIKEIAKGLPYRDFVTIGLLVKRLSLRNRTKIKTLGNIVPDCWIYVQDTGVKLGRIQVFNNWSPYMVKHPQQRVWIGLEYFCKEGDEFWNMDEKKCAHFAIKELISMGVLPDKSVVLDAHRERVKKAYPAYFDTYEEFDRIVSYLDGIENLYCIGRNGQHRYNNMDHSMVTAFEAVDNIISKRKDKSNIWNVNTEQEYHEEKV